MTRSSCSSSATLHADRLATFYSDPSKNVTPAPDASNSLMPAQCTQMAQPTTTGKAVGEVRAESDHLAFNMRSQIPSGDNAPPAPTNGQSTLAQSMPSDTAVYVEMRNTGNSIGWLIKKYMACLTASGQPGTGLGVSGTGTDPSQIFEQFLGASPDEYLNFVGDAALGVELQRRQAQWRHHRHGRRPGNGDAARRQARFARPDAGPVRRQRCGRDRRSRLTAPITTASR